MLPEYLQNTVSFRGACGRADLLYALAAAVQGNLEDDITGRELAFAGVLNFALVLKDQGTTPNLTLTVPAPTPIEPEPPIPQAALFHPYRLVSIETVQSEADWQTTPVEVTETSALTLTDLAAWDNRYPVPTAQPIVPWTRLWPKLRQAVASQLRGGVDFKALTESLAQGRALRQLPRLTRLAWPSPLTVVFDYSDRLTPYWDDWHWLNQSLTKQLHQQVRCYRLRGVPHKPLQRLSAGQPEPLFREWPDLSAGSTLLVFSDLGMVDAAHPWPGQCWQDKLAHYQRQGVCVVVMALVSLRQVQPALVNAAQTVRLSPDSSLRPLAHLRSAALPVPQENSNASTLLAMLAVATKAEIGLLRDLRACLPEAAQDVGLEGEVWCHPHLDTAATACAVSPYAVAEWRAAFQQLPDDLQQRTLDCIRVWHARLPQAIHHEETLMWHGLTALPDTNNELNQARAFFERLANSMLVSTPANPTAHALQMHLAGRHVQWVAPTLGEQAYLIGLTQALHKADPLRFNSRGLPEGLDLVAWLQALPPQSPQLFTVWQQPDLSLCMQVMPFSVTLDSLQWGIEPLGGKGSLGITPLANVMIDREALLWAWEAPQHVPVYRPWHWQTETGPTLSILAEAQDNSTPPTLTLHTGRLIYRLQALTQPAWASAWGQDRYGLYADLDIQGITQRFRWINPGRFLMGSPEHEPERSNAEQQHPVTLTEGYWLADTACTQALWMALMGGNPSRFQEHPDYPVENVSWEDVQKFITQLNNTYPELFARLPTEAEWEYACRAGTLTPFAFGENITPEQVNYNGSVPYANGSKGQYRAQTVPVKRLPVNPWGLYEMHGNVWEWCADWYGDYSIIAVVTDPVGPTKGAYRVLRGGSWLYDAWNSRSANRHWINPDVRDDSHGFRLALGQKGLSPGEPAGRGTVAGRQAAAERGQQARHRAPPSKGKKKKSR